MGHRINISQYQVRTDLAIEAIQNLQDHGIEPDVISFDDITVTNIYVDDKSGGMIGKKKGNYTTIEFSDVTDFEYRERLKQVFSDCLKDLMKKVSIGDNASCLVIGLGNERSTPDSLGPMVIDQLLVTNHLFYYGDVEDGFRRVSAICPGVMGETGIETSDLICSVVDSLKPDFLIVIDALASQSIDRVNRTIQMTDSGIHPGSGVGNKRKEISFDTVHIPVISIGVPTVVDAVTIVSDTIHYMFQHFAYMKDHVHNPSYRLVPLGSGNYLNYDGKMNIHEKQELMGMVGGLNDAEIRDLIFEVLTPIGYNLMVTPKEVDFVMEHLSDVIGNGINRSLHRNVEHL